MRGRQAVLGVALALVVVGMAVPPASASYDPVVSGQTRISFSKEFRGALAANGVRIVGEGSARVAGGVATLGVSGGKFDPVSEKGDVDHEGALRFKTKSRSVALEFIAVKSTRRTSPFTAKVGGGQLKLGSKGRLKVVRRGFGVTLKTSGWRLSAKLAQRLNKRLHLRDGFEEGQLVGSATTVAEPATVALMKTGSVAFTPDPGIVAKFDSVHVAINPIFPVEHAISAPLFTLPIFAGALAPDGSGGSLETLGSLELLQLGGGQLFWQGIWLDVEGRVLSAELDLEPSPPYAGKSGRVPIASVDLSTASISSDPGKRTIAIDNATLTLQASTAANFNELFAKPLERADVFRSGEVLGHLSFVATAF